jgi:hypothetical protein
VHFPLQHALSLAPVPYPIQSVSDVHEPPRGVPEDGAVVVGEVVGEEDED